MTIRLPLSTKYVRWRDAQQVSVSDMTTEQSHNIQSVAGVANNFFGSGLVPNVSTREYLFDSSNLTEDQQIRLTAGEFDGQGTEPAGQPIDSSLGAQLEIELTDSDVFGRYPVKVLVLGLDFQDELQYEKFIFYRNEIQIGKKHFSRILSFLFNDFRGNKNGSRDQGGRITVKEALPLEFSRDPILASQDVEPDLFFRDFKVADPTIGANPTTALYLTLAAAVGASYDPDTLNIAITWQDIKELETDDIATRYGQKFLSTGNNIQKVTMLLGVQLNGTDPEHYYDWTGELIINVHALQTSVACLSDTVPENTIDFPPEPVPLAQISVSQASLLSRGIVLTDVAQPVDFIFNSTRIGNYVNSGIVADNYYLFSIQRSGDTSGGTLFTLTGNNRIETSKLSFFNGDVWTDDEEQDLWYQIWTDAARVADGMGIDAGNSFVIPKTDIDADTGATIDYSEDHLAFANNGQNIDNYAVAQAITEQSDEVQDQRTGNNVYSMESNKASISLLSSSDVTTLKEDGDPIILGNISDTNPRTTASTITGTQTIPGLAKSNSFCIVEPDAALLSATLIGAKLVPNILTTYEYRIFDATLCEDFYGDVDGNGVIDLNDITRATELIGHGLALEATQTAIANGTVEAVQILRADVNGDGVVTAADVTLITQYINKQISIFPIGKQSFNRLCIKVAHNVGRNDGYWDGGVGFIRTWNMSLPLVPLPTDPTELLYYGRPDAVLLETDPAFTTVPFESVDFRITYDGFWREDLIRYNYSARLMPCSFVSQEQTSSYETDDTLCPSRLRSVTADGGRNDFFVPDSLIIDKGQILSPDGSYHKIDLEIQTIILNMPAIPMSGGHIDVFNMFIADNGDGKTKGKYTAMKFADGSFVSKAATDNGQIRFGVSIQSYSPNIDGYDSIDGYGIITDPNIGIWMTSAGILYFSVANLYDTPYDPMLKTKIQITVYAKKGGWQNTPIEVPSDYIVGLDANS